MANYCSYCGASVSSNDSYCPNCGAALNASVNNNNNTQAASNTSSAATGAAAGILGTLVAVTLTTGLTRNLYYYGGRYYLDPYCRRPFVGGIRGPHHMVGPGPRGPRGGPGPRGGMGGPRGGGPGGGPRGGGPGGGPRGGGPGGGGRR
ncbi:MAG: zinc-ribbon domain-containing protein [Clostridia bacterium]|nr:zinc-ribbon domain-containing protein [Clostridia bacterium]